MRESTVSTFLFAFVAFVALACTPNPAFAQRGGGVHVDGTHYGGGGGHYSGGGGHYGAPGGRSYSGSRGYRGGAPPSGLNGSGATWHTYAGRPSGMPAFNSGAVSGNRGSGSSGAGRSRPAVPPPRAYFGTSGTARNFNPAGGSSGGSSASAARASGSGTVDSQRHSFANAGNASVARAPGASGPAAGGAMAANTHAPSLSADSNRWWSGQGRDRWADHSRLTTTAPRATGSTISANRVLSNFENSHVGNTPLSNSRFARSSLGNSVMGNSRFGGTALSNSAFANPRFGVGTTFGHPFGGTGFRDRGSGFRGFPQRALSAGEFFFDRRFFFSTSFLFGPRFVFRSPFFFANPFFFPGPRVFIFFGDGFCSPFLFTPVAFDPFLVDPFCPFF